MSYRIRIAPTVHSQITSWRLTDYLLVEVYLYLEAVAGSPLTHVQQLQMPFAGMGCGLVRIDPANRFCEHFFTFRAYFGQDEETITLTEAFYRRQFGD